MIKVVHVLGRLDRGGIETWLKDVILHYDRENFQMDFVTNRPGEGVYDEIIVEMGSKLNPILLDKGIWKFSRAFYKFLKAEQYNIVHAHSHFFSGYICFIAFLAGVSCRISHSHNDTSKIDSNSFYRKCYIEIQRMLINIFATKRVACSEPAGKALFKNKSHEIIQYGINLSNFKKKEDNTRSKILKEFNLPENAFFIGHVGSFSEQKNHDFLIDIYFHISKGNPNIYLLLIGEGKLQEDIKKKVGSLNLKNVLFLGGRNDVNLFMSEIFDIFLFPSLYEGLGIVLLEAQMAGLKCIISDVIPHDAIIIKENIRNLSLKDNSQKWANSLMEMLDNKNNIDYNSIVDKMYNSPFNITNSVASLENIYNQCVNK
ncbi:glycosyltransferase [Viscerimonas tarda]